MHSHVRALEGDQRDATRAKVDAALDEAGHSCSSVGNSPTGSPSQVRVELGSSPGGAGGPGAEVAAVEVRA